MIDEDDQRQMTINVDNVIFKTKFNFLLMVNKIALYILIIFFKFKTMCQLLVKITWKLFLQVSKHILVDDDYTIFEIFMPQMSTTKKKTQVKKKND